MGLYNMVLGGKFYVIQNVSIYIQVHENMCIAHYIVTEEEERKETQT